MRTAAREPRVRAIILSGSLTLALNSGKLAADGMPGFLARETEAATISAARQSEAGWAPDRRQECAGETRRHSQQSSRFAASNLISKI